MRPEHDITDRDRLGETMADPPGFSPDARVSDRCRMHLSAPLQHLLHAAARIGDEADIRVYAVGGFVRDLLLGVRNDDLDLSVEGDGIAFAQRLAAGLGGVSRGPSEFGTSVVIAADGHKIDVATARRETYQRPAALPTVESGTIRDDLARRDFSINTLAFPLNGPEAFILLDWIGGCADLRAGVIRVLHNRSFRDDPTRIFRAIRLEQRLAFSLHPHTLRLLQRAVAKRWIELLSGARLWRELRFMLAGESPVRCLMRLEELGVLSQIDSTLALSPERVAVLTAAANARAELADIAPEVKTRAWLASLAALLQGSNAGAIRRVCQRLTLSPRVVEELMGGIGAVEDACVWLQAQSAMRPSKMVAVLRKVPLEMLPLIVATCPGRAVREHIRRYLTEWRHVRPSVTGHDLKRWGVPQGPLIGQLLARLQAAKLDGEAPTWEAEEALAQGAMRQLRS